MTIVKSAVRTVITTFALICALFLGAFVFLAYNSPDTITEVACALQTSTVAEESTCLYIVNNS